MAGRSGEPGWPGRERTDGPDLHARVPPGLQHDAKQRLARQISKTIGEACGREVEEIRLPSGTKIYNKWVLGYFWELPPDKVALGDLSATENPLVLENLPHSKDAEPAVTQLKGEDGVVGRVGERAG
jgi:hypothetical protein